MPILYTKDGKQHVIQHPIDAVAAINSGNYFEENPVQVSASKSKVEMPVQEPKAKATPAEPKAPVEDEKEAPKMKDEKPVKIGRI